MGGRFSREILLNHGWLQAVIIFFSSSCGYRLVTDLIIWFLISGGKRINTWGQVLVRSFVRQTLIIMHYFDMCLYTHVNCKKKVCMVAISIRGDGCPW